MEALICHAYERACQLPGQRPEAGVVTKELRILAEGDRDVIHRAWDHCVQRYAQQEQLAWLRAATYLLPLELELQHERVRARHSRADGRTQRAGSRQDHAEVRHGAVRAHRRGEVPRGTPGDRGHPGGGSVAGR